VAGAGIWVSFAVIAGYQLGRAAPATSARRRVGAVILTKENKQRQLDFDSDADRQRNRIEQLINRLSTRGKTPGKEEDRQMPCNYGTLLKSNFRFCKIYLIEQITSMLHYSPIQNCCQG
jgi:hypothetical protein